MCVRYKLNPTNLLPDTLMKISVDRQSAEDRKIGSTPDNSNAGSRRNRKRLVLVLTPLSDDHSRVEPPLPIPNRTVKRSRANDSRHYACESRSSSDSLSVPQSTQNPLPQRGGFLLAPPADSRKLHHPTGRICCSQSANCFPMTLTF